MSKRQFVFYWLDSPSMATAEARSDIAARFRAYRRKPNLYALHRESPEEYRVHIAGTPPGPWAAVGVFRAIPTVNIVSGKELSNA